MIARPDLAAHAGKELAAREEHWPAEIAAQRMTRSAAEADIAAWRAIAALLGDGTAETPLAWADLLAAAEAAEQRRLDQALAAKDEHGRTNPKLEARLGQIIDIRRLIERSAWRHGQCLEAA